MTDYPEIKMCGADLPVLTTPQSETPRTDEDGCEDTDDALALILTGRHVDSQNIGELPSAALYKIRDLQRRLREAEKDAERYRWLRQHPTFLGWDGDYSDIGIDREVDAARAEEKK